MPVELVADIFSKLVVFAGVLVVVVVEEEGVDIVGIGVGLLLLLSTKTGAAAPSAAAVGRIDLLLVLSIGEDDVDAGERG